MNFYFQFQFWPFIPHRNVILHLCIKFYPNQTIAGRVVTLYAFFKMAAVCPFGFGIQNDWPPTVSVVVSTWHSSFVLTGFVVSGILLLIYCGFLAWMCLFKSTHVHYQKEIYFWVRNHPHIWITGNQFTYSTSKNIALWIRDILSWNPRC